MSDEGRLLTGRRPSSRPGRPGPSLVRGLVSSAVSRPTRFEDFRDLGDKRRQVVYDLDSDDPESVERVEELLASERFAAFAPDTLAEAANRGYRPHRSAVAER